MRVFDGCSWFDVKSRVALAALLTASLAAAVPATDELSSAVASPPPAVPVEPAPTIAPSPVTEVDRTLEEIGRQERDLKRENEGLGHESQAAHSRTIARARAYVRLARAGLLPVGGGFDALVDHATKVERMH